MKVIIAIALIASVLAPAGIGASAPTTEKRPFRGHVPAVIEHSHLKAVGRLPGTNTLRLAIALPVRNGDALNHLFQELYSPASPQFRRFLTPAQFTEQFGPTPQDYEAVMQFARTNGLTVTRTHSNRLLFNVEGRVADIETAFDIQMQLYQHPSESRCFFAPDREPSFRSGLQVLEICGLNNYPMLSPQGGSIPSSNVLPPGYGGSDFRAAYIPGVTLTGAGQTVGLVAFDGYYTNAISQYANLVGNTNVNLTNVLLDGATGVPGYSGLSGWYGEVALDIEMVMSMAPDAQIIVYEGFANETYSFASFSVAFADVLNRMATDNLAKQISCSWIYHGDSVVSAAVDQIFQELAIQGQSFFQSSGDWGAGWLTYSGVADTNWTCWPADSPYVTSVGGTELSTTGPGGAWVSETVWNEHVSSAFYGYAGSGGVSPNYSIPSWQQGIDMTLNGGSTTMRNVPDVAMVADGIAAVEQPGETLLDCGTSAAAPLWAGFMALVNQQAATNGQAPIGFINPAIYAIAKGPNYASAFHDVTIGDNTNRVSSNLFFAVQGYDLCTGLGTPAGQNLITLLLNPSEPMGLTPAAGFISANGPAGGQFNITSQAFLLTTTGPSSFAWSVGNCCPWLNVFPASGTLAAGATATVTASLSSQASNLAPGQYSTTVWFTNLTSGAVLNRQFALQVAQPLVQNGGFETGDFSSWTGTGLWTPYNLVGRIGGPTVFDDPSYGNYVMLYGGSFNEGPIFLSQTVPTTPGQSYLLSFWLMNLKEYLGGSVLVTWDGATIFNQTNWGVGQAYPSTNFQFIVPAFGTSSAFQIGLGEYGSDYGWSFYLEDVSLIPLLAPAFQQVTQTNGALSFAWSTMTGFGYQVQYVTNPAQKNWNNLGVPLIATNSITSASDTLGPDQQRYYRVALIAPP